MYRCVARRLSTSSLLADRHFDCVMIGSGHNGLVAASYLARKGVKVAVLEKRPLIGGASVTEELWPGYKISRASYLFSLFRQRIVRELELEKHGLKLLPRNPSSFTPLSDERYLLLGSDDRMNQREISKFSYQDANLFPKYEAWMTDLADLIEPWLEAHPILPRNILKQTPLLNRSFKQLSSGGFHRLLDLWQVLTSPADKILHSWIESEPLLSTLATDSIIGAFLSPSTPGSAYVLLHHVMGGGKERWEDLPILERRRRLREAKLLQKKTKTKESNEKGLEGVESASRNINDGYLLRPGSWAYVQGGMGALAQAIARSATAYGAEVFTDAEVAQIVCTNGKVEGVILADNSFVGAKCVVSNATPSVTFLELCKKNTLPSDFRRHIESIDTKSPVTKINVALSSLPNFKSFPTFSESATSRPSSSVSSTSEPSFSDAAATYYTTRYASFNPSKTTSPEVGPHHIGTIHLGCENLKQIEQAYLDALSGIPSRRPIIEMTIPSTLDPTLAPSGHHVASLFVQYTPARIPGGWTEENKQKFADTCFKLIDEYAPGFSRSVLHADILPPPELERIFSLTGGNIFHGAMGLDQLFWMRPVPGFCESRTPVKGLYLCGAGSHPGGGVLGAPGKLASTAVLEDARILKLSSRSRQVVVKDVVTSVMSSFRSTLTSTPDSHEPRKTSAPKNSKS